MTNTETNRISDAELLMDDFNLRQDAEFFASPQNRIELLVSLTPEDFLDLTKHINDRVRGFEPRERTNIKEEGGVCLF